MNKILTKTLDLKLGAQEAFRLLKDANRLFRLDPKWEVREVKPLSGEDGGLVEVDLMDDLTEKDYRDRLTFEARDNELEIGYHEGWKRRTSIRVEPRGPGSRIHLTEEFKLPRDVRAGHIEHLGREQLRWLASISQYLRLYEKPTPYRRLMRRLMNRIWLPMTPSQRRIALIIVAVQALTLAAFVMAGLFVWLKVLIEGFL